LEGERKLRQNSSDLPRTAEEIAALMEIKHACLPLAPNTEHKVPPPNQLCMWPGNGTVRERAVRSGVCGLA